MDCIEHVRQHPPRCIAGFDVRPTELPGVQFDGHGSLPAHLRGIVSAPEHINPIFALACKCGSNLHRVHGHEWTNPHRNNEVWFISPLALECAACGRMTDLFDSDAHGYDAELGSGVSAPRAEGRRVMLGCEDCEPTSFEAFARFEYPDDIFDGQTPEYAGREQDLFSWFTLVAKCSHCARMTFVADFECA